MVAALLAGAVWLGDAARGQLANFSFTTISIPMRDANVLAADLWYAGATPTAKPVILIQTPYNRKLYRLGIIPDFAGGATFPANTNYNYVIVDWRGFFDSSSAAVPGYNRGLDGYDCVEWIAPQSWSNGRVGTWGSSALGAIQYQTAFQQPPHLVCCTIQVRFFQTGYADYYYGGDYRKEQAEGTASLGLTDPALILAHPAQDLFWRTVETLSDTPEQMNVPALIVGGWFDHSPDAVLESFARLRARSAPVGRDQHHLIYGPWTHGGLSKTNQGVLAFPNATSLAATEMEFWDFHLRQLTNNSWTTQPVVQFYQMGENIWLDERNWSGTNTWAGVPRVAKTLYLRAGGALSPETPGASEGAATFTYDPNDPTPTFGGARFTPLDSSVPEGPQNLATNLELRADVTVFSTVVLTNDLRLNATNLTLTLYAASDRTDTDFAVRLTDVYPDGSSIILAQGIRRARFRDSLSTEQLLTPGVVYSIPVTLQNLAHTFRIGHRLRLVISGADYPMYDRNLNDGGPLYTNGTPLVAHNSLFHETAHASRLDFQVLPDDLDSDGLADVWEGDYFGGLQRNGAADFDGDGFSDANEFQAGTNPTNAASLLRIETISVSAPNQVAITWQSVSNRTYDLLAATGSPTATYLPVATNLTATPPLNTVPVQPPATGAWFLRVRVNP
jgi:uncharacterized protein